MYIGAHCSYRVLVSTL